MEEEQQDIAHALQIGGWLAGGVVAAWGLPKPFGSAVSIPLAVAGLSTRMKVSFIDRTAPIISCPFGNLSRAGVM